MKNLFLCLILTISSTLSSQTLQFNGTWTKVSTTYKFDFDLILKVSSSNQVEGYFLWKVIEYDKNNILSKQHYEKKINLTAKEYVKGIYYPSKGEYVLKGYKKDDPDNIIGIDIYELKIDRNGELGGITNSNGSWLGRINGKQIEKDLL